MIDITPEIMRAYELTLSQSQDMWYHVIWFSLFQYNHEYLVTNSAIVNPVNRRALALCAACPELLHTLLEPIPNPEIREQYFLWLYALARLNRFHFNPYDIAWHISEVAYGKDLLEQLNFITTECVVFQFDYPGVSYSPDISFFMLFFCFISVVILLILFSFFFFKTNFINTGFISVFVLFLLFVINSIDYFFCGFSGGTLLQVTKKAFVFQFIIVLFLLGFLLASIPLKLNLRSEVFFLISLLCLFVFYLFVSVDFISFVLSFEGINFILYILAVTNLSREPVIQSFNKIRSSIRYIAFGIFSSSLLIFGLTLFYTFTGLICFEDVYLFLKYLIIENDHTYRQLFFATLLISIAFVFKLGLAPLHNWLVDLYKTNDDILVFLFSIFTKLLFMFILLYKFSFLFLFLEIRYLFFIVGIISIVVGTFGALSQTTVNGLIAYSSIANLGNATLMASYGFNLCTTASVFFVIGYAIINVSLFFVLFQIRTVVNVARYPRNINDYKSFFCISPELSLALAFTIFALIGLPPFLGFFYKFFLLTSLFYAISFYVFFFVMFLNIIGAFYYLRFIVLLCFYNDFHTINFPFDKIYPMTEHIGYTYYLVLLLLVFPMYVIDHYV